jgi:hypothetical protein
VDKIPEDLDYTTNFFASVAELEYEVEGEQVEAFRLCVK